MFETEHAVRLANKVLDDPTRDPDDDLATLARQFLRAREAIAVERERCAKLAVETIDDYAREGCWIRATRVELTRIVAAAIRAMPEDTG